MTVRVPKTDGDGFEGWTVDFRETAPAGSSRNMYVGRHHDAQVGGLAVGVPGEYINILSCVGLYSGLSGEVMGLAEAHRRWAKLPWSTLVKPARDLARGFPVGRELARRLPWFEQLLVHNPDWSPIFAPEGRVLKEGEILRRTNLSRTLDILRKEGISSFYNVCGCPSLLASE
jgi:gamma-glutamyltranspeptidase/glutathione hydrolase/leukotriene-C4 hydrolase